jgi:type IV secretory pathway VirB3-like protein
LSVADHGFISGVIVSLLILSVADHGFISGVIVSLLTLSVADFVCNKERRVINSILYKINKESRTVYNLYYMYTTWQV